MQFEWDDDKARRNIEKHGVSFNEAAQIFLGPTLTAFDRRKDYGEPREISIGKVGDLVCLVVVHTNRQGVTRLISARRAKRSERNRYDEYIQKITR